MPVVVALLRGVNVGGKGRLAMADLKQAVEGAGHEDVRTYIQSGNVVLRSSETSTSTLAAGLRRSIAAATGLDTDIFVRTLDELAAVVDANPFPGSSDVHVVFTAEDPGPSLAGLDLAPYAPEEAVAIGPHVYLHLPGGIGRSRLAADLARRAGPAGTTRGWRTVVALLDLARQVDGA